MIEINNLPENPKRYVVAQYCIDAGYWFWGSYDNEEDARYVAREVGGEVFDRGDSHE